LEKNYIMSDTCPRLNAFYEEVKKNGILINNRYKLSLQLPTGGLRDTFEQANAQWIEGGSAGHEDFEFITIWADGAKLPNRQQNTVEFKYQGYPLQYPSNFVYEQEFELNLRSQENLQYRNAFLAWQDAMSAADFDGEKAWGVAGGGYKTIGDARAFVTIFDQSMRTPLQTYVLEGVFPVNVGTVEFTNDDPQIATYTVQFKVQYWKVVNGDKDAAVSNTRS